MEKLVVSFGHFADRDTIIVSCHWGITQALIQKDCSKAFLMNLMLQVMRHYKTLMSGRSCLRQ
jgi:hypothetical protein